MTLAVRWVVTLNFLFSAVGLIDNALADGAVPSGKLSDKSTYTLFHPVPDDQQRDLNPDRPSRFTSPTTVDAGHYLLETDVVNYTQDRHNPERERADVDQWNFPQPELRIGLTEHTEIDFLYEGYLNRRTREPDQRRVRFQSGSGDLLIQGKYNLFGNDTGDVAFGILPYIKLPTNTAHLGNGFVEGGLEFPLSINLPGNFSLGLETEFDALRNDADTRHVAGFTNTAFLGYNFLGKKLQIYGEWFSRVTAGPGSRLDGEVDTGLVYFVGKNAEVDFGCNFGVTRAAPDFEPFIGFSKRF